MAARADCDGTLARSYGHLDALLVGTEVGLLVDKTPVTMAAVQDRDQFHGADESGRRNLHHKPVTDAGSPLGFNKLWPIWGDHIE